MATASDSKGFESPRSCRSQEIMHPATPCRTRRMPSTPPPLFKHRSSLLTAILRDDVAALESVLQDDPYAAQLPIAYGGSLPESPLCVAILSGASPEIGELLLRYGAHVNLSNVSDKSPLLLVASSRPIFNSGCRARADTWTIEMPPSLSPSARPRAGTYPKTAASPGFYNFVDVFGQSDDGDFLWTFPFLPPLSQTDIYHHSAERSVRMSDDHCLAFAEVLLRHGANVHQKDADGKTALDYAKLHGRDILVGVLNNTVA